jgi:hypothetical protein
MEMTAKIAAALHEVMSKVGYVQKTGRNSFHNYRYAGEADLLAVLRPAMVEAGLLLIPSVVDHSPIDEHGNKDVVIEYTLAHKDGDVWPHKVRAIGTGNDKNKNGVGDKGTYKALTGANKYLLFKLFQIETGDDPEKDGDEEREGSKRPPANGNKPAPTPPPEKTERDTLVDELRAYAQQVKEALELAPDVHTVKTIWREEGPALAELKTKSEKAHAHLVAVAQKRGFKEAA